MENTDLYVIRDGKLVPYAPIEIFKIKDISLNISKALDLIDEWNMEEIEWNLNQITYYLEHVIVTNMNLVKNPYYRKQNKVFMDLGNIDYLYPDNIDIKKVNIPGILLPKRFIELKHDIVVDGNHRLIRCYREGINMKMKILTEDQFQQLII